MNKELSVKPSSIVSRIRMADRRNLHRTFKTEIEDPTWAVKYHFRSIMKVCAHLPTIDDPQVQHLANEDARAYLLCLKYEKEFATIASKLRSMHPIRMFALKSPSAYFGARMIATSSILVHFLNVTSSYLVSSLFFPHSLHVKSMFRPSCPVKESKVERHVPANTPQGPPSRL